MNQLKIRVEWNVSDGYSASQAVTDLNRVHYGFTALRFSHENLSGQYLEFFHRSWPQAQRTVTEIQLWLREKGVKQSWICINDQLLEDFLREQLFRARGSLSIAVDWIKSTRRLFPNPQMKEDRMRMEQTLELLHQVLD